MQNILTTCLRLLISLKELSILFLAYNAIKLGGIMQVLEIIKGLSFIVTITMYVYTA